MVVCVLVLHVNALLPFNLQELCSASRRETRLFETFPATYALSLHFNFFTAFLRLRGFFWCSSLSFGDDSSPCFLLVAAFRSVPSGTCASRTNMLTKNPFVASSPGEHLTRDWASSAGRFVNNAREKRPHNCTDLGCLARLGDRALTK